MDYSSFTVLLYVERREVTLGKAKGVRKYLLRVGTVFCYVAHAVLSVSTTKEHAGPWFSTFFYFANGHCSRPGARVGSVKGLESPRGV